MEWLIRFTDREIDICNNNIFLRRIHLVDEKSFLLLSIASPGGDHLGSKKRFGRAENEAGTVGYSFPAHYSLSPICYY